MSIVYIRILFCLPEVVSWTMFVQDHLLRLGQSVILAMSGFLFMIMGQYPSLDYTIFTLH